MSKNFLRPTHENVSGFSGLSLWARYFFMKTAKCQIFLDMSQNEILHIDFLHFNFYDFDFFQTLYFEINFFQTLYFEISF